MAAILTPETEVFKAKHPTPWATSHSGEIAEAYAPGTKARAIVSGQDDAANLLQKAQARAKLAGLTIFEPDNVP